MDFAENEALPEGGFDTYFPVLQTYARSGAVRKLSGLAELSFIGGRAGDWQEDWERDIGAALSEIPGLNGGRRARVMERLKDHFYRGCDANLSDAASPPQMARDFASGLTLVAAQRVKRASPEAVDEAIAAVAEQVARDLPVSIPSAARATMDAFRAQGIVGTRIAECLAVQAARIGWRQRGGFAAELREIEGEVYAHEYACAGEAVSAHAAALAERHHDGVEVAVETALIAADRHGFDVQPEHAKIARDAASAAKARMIERWEADEAAESYPVNAKPPAWWIEHCEGGVPDRFELEREPGLLGDLARWSVNYAFRPVPEFAALVALATLAPVFSRRFATPTAAGLNLYLIGLAETGGGKEAVIGAPQALLGAAKLDFLIGAGDFTSDSAIELALRSRPNFLACIDEVSEFIGAAQHRNAAAHARTLRKAMLELYSKSRADARWSGKQKVDADNADKAATPIYAPHLSLLGCATVAGFFEALTDGNLTGGFVNRWIVVRGGRPGTFNADPARLAVPNDLKAALAAAYADATKGNLSDGAARDPLRQPHMRIVPWGDGGEEAWHSILLIQAEAVDAGRGDVVGRAAENCLKVATIRALAREGLNAAVTDRDVLWAWEIVRASVETVEVGARENMAGSEFEMLVKTMESHIVGAGPEGIAWTKLLEKRGVSKHTDGMLDGALKRLEARDVIYKPAIGTGPKGGRPGLRVVATQFTRE